MRYSTEHAYTQTAVKDTMQNTMATPPILFTGGVDDDDDDGNLPQPSQFSINGIEIDLDELEQLEARVRQKRTKNESDSKSANEIGSDVLEGHLGRTKFHSDDGCSSQTGQESTKDDLDLLYEEIQHKQALARANEVEQGRQKMASFVSVLLMFTSLLAFINQICYRGENQLLDEPEEQVDDEEEENEEQQVEDMEVEVEKDECCSLGATGDSNARVEALPQMENGSTAPSDATILAVAADDRPARADQN